MQLRDTAAFVRIYRDLGSGLLRPVESPVPKCEGPGAPSSVVYKACRTGATRHSRADTFFRTNTTGPASAPKVWADAWLLAVAEAAGGVLVTFDKALAARGALCLLSKRS